MKQTILILIISVVLTGCGSSSTHSYYKKLKDKWDANGGKLSAQEVEVILEATPGSFQMRRPDDEQMRNWSAPGEGRKGDKMILLRIRGTNVVELMEGKWTD